MAPSVQLPLSSGFRLLTSALSSLCRLVSILGHLGGIALILSTGFALALGGLGIGLPAHLLLVFLSGVRRFLLPLKRLLEAFTSLFGLFRSTGFLIACPVLPLRFHPFVVVPDFGHLPHSNPNDRRLASRDAYRKGLRRVCKVAALTSFVDKADL